MSKVKKVVDAMELEKGQKISVRPGKVETVTEPSRRDRFGGVEITTDKSTLITGLPCPVAVVE